MKIKIEGETWEIVRIPISAGCCGKGTWRIEKPGVSVEVSSNCSLQEFLNLVKGGDSVWLNN